MDCLLYTSNLLSKGYIQAVCEHTHGKTDMYTHIGLDEIDMMQYLGIPYNCCLLYTSTIPFPVLRLGNTEKVMEAIKYINELRTQVQSCLLYTSRCV